MPIPSGQPPKAALRLSALGGTSQVELSVDVVDVDEGSVRNPELFSQPRLNHDNEFVTYDTSDSFRGVSESGAADLQWNPKRQLAADKFYRPFK